MHVYFESQLNTCTFWDSDDLLNHSILRNKVAIKIVCKEMHSKICMLYAHYRILADSNLPSFITLLCMAGLYYMYLFRKLVV